MYTCQKSWLKTQRKRMPTVQFRNSSDTTSYMDEIKITIRLEKNIATRFHVTPPNHKDKNQRICIRSTNDRLESTPIVQAKRF
jgi:hypothetical protein